MKHKNITNFSAKIIAGFSEQGRSWFTLQEAYSLFSDLSEIQIRVQIKRMADEGLLMRVQDGVYYMIP